MEENRYRGGEPISWRRTDVMGENRYHGGEPISWRRTRHSVQKDITKDISQ